MDAAKAVGLFFWMKTADVEEKPIKAVVEGVTMEPTEYQPDGAMILWLDGNRKLVLSKTRVGQMSKIASSTETDDWMGREIEMYRDEIRGKACISLRSPLVEGGESTDPF